MGFAILEQLKCQQKMDATTLNCHRLLLAHIIEV
jgi:hypothetical protein